MLKYLWRLRHGEGMKSPGAADRRGGIEAGAAPAHPRPAEPEDGIRAAESMRRRLPLFSEASACPPRRLVCSRVIPLCSTFVFPSANAGVSCPQQPLFCARMTATC